MFIRRFKLFTFTFTLHLLFSTFALYAQYYKTGVEPFNTKWKKKEFQNIRLIFPTEADSMANIFLSSLTLSDSLNDTDYSIGKKRMDVVLHPNTVLSNGFVAWAPRRMELVTQPDAGNDASMWHQTLSIHEMRHVKQLYVLNVGTVKLASWLLGQQAVGLASAMVNPWIFEGDAVWAETLFSYSGRGRSGNFFQHYYAFFNSGLKSYSYDKWLLGSYKDYVPNHYQFGYQLTHYINQKYGNLVIPNTYRFVGRYPFTLFPTYFALKKQTGLSRKNIFQKAFAFNDSIWRNDYLKHPNKTQVQPGSNGYQSFLYPFPVNDSVTIAYINSLKKTPFFAYTTDNGEISKIVSTGYVVGRPNYTDSLIIWAELHPHPRWEWKSLNNIKVFNLHTKSEQLITTGRFFSPAYDGATYKIYCLEYTAEGNYYLTRVSMNGDTERVFSFESGYEIQEICVDSEHSNIYGVAVTKYGKMIFRIDSTFRFESIFDGKFRDIRSISYYQNNLFFTFTDGFTENIYSLDLSDYKLYILQNTPVNSTFPVGKNGNLIFSHYTSGGYRISKVKDILHNRYNLDSISSFNHIVKINKHILNDFHDVVNYKTDDYVGLKPLFNVHSWFPVYMKPLSDPSDIESQSPIFPGITLLSQNLTGTTQINAGYGYNHTHLLFASLSYSGLWPVINLSVEQTDSPAWLYRVTQLYPLSRDFRKRAELGLYIPYTFSGGLYLSSLQLYNKLVFTNDYLYNESENAYRSGLYTNEFGFVYYSLRRMAHRDLQPRYGFLISTGIVATPWDYNNLPNLWFGKAKFYLPGIIVNQGLSITLNTQSQSIKYIYLNNKVNFPRGYVDMPSVQYNGVSIDYTLPIVYPDLNISSLVYIKRVSLILFSDFAENRYKTIIYNSIVTLTDKLQSVGFSTYIDLHLFRTWYPFRLKFTQAFTGKYHRAFSDLTFSIDINSTFATR